ncbi:MAG: type II toxin-antitoxin system VapC family toxin [Thermoanaerobaculia bacterium]
MILVDTGPLVALFDPKEEEHTRCREVLRELTAPLATTLPVLTEAFHILSPESIGSDRLRQFILEDGLQVLLLDRRVLERAFELMETYGDRPMDLADASLIAVAESIPTRRVFTLDHDDFSTYRVRRGHRHLAVEILR